MIKIAGVDVFDTLAELVNPGYSAVLVIDMQNDGTSVDGAVYKGGTDNSMIRALVTPVANFLDEARKYSVPVVFVQVFRSFDGRVIDSPAFLRTTSRTRKWVPDSFVYGTWGWELTPELKRRPGEPIVAKCVPGCFTDTNMDRILRNMGIQTCIIVGEQTAGCVLGAAMGASDNGYYTVIVSDCVAAFTQEQHDAAMTIMRQRYDVATSEEIVREWAKLAQKSSKK